MKRVSYYVTNYMSMSVNRHITVDSGASFLRQSVPQCANVTCIQGDLYIASKRDDICLLFTAVHLIW